MYAAQSPRPDDEAIGLPLGSDIGKDTFGVTFFDIRRHGQASSLQRLPQRFDHVVHPCLRLDCARSTPLIEQRWRRRKGR